MLIFAYDPSVDQPKAAQLMAKLRGLGITYQAAPFPSDYEGTLQNFAQLHSSSLLVTTNTGTALTPLLAYAILLQKPIILLGNARYGSSYLNAIIHSRLNKIYFCDLTILDDEDASTLVSAIVEERTNYVLSQHDIVLIRSYLRNYFRQLLSVA